MTMLQADIAVIGASLGGVLAAWQAASRGRTVLLTSQYDWLGGQMTAQGVPPDEHKLIEHGGASASYQAFRAAIRQHYQAQPDFRDHTAMTEGCNPGDGWVSRLCFEPRVAAEYFEALLAPLVAQGRLRILRGAVATAAQRDGRRIAAVTVNTPAGPVQLQAGFFLDGTDTGELLKLAGLPYRLGKEARREFGEPDAPEQADWRDQQPVTMVMALGSGNGKSEPLAQPASYGFWRSHVLPHYGYPLFSNSIPGSGRGQAIQLPFFGSGQTLDLWRYRRVVCAHNWAQAREEASLINWAQNDYGLQPLLDGELDEAGVVAAARELSLCLCYWLQHHAPRHDGQGQGYPNLRLLPELLGTSDGLAQQVYVRESRRIVGLDTLSQTPLLADGGPLTPYVPAKSVGVAWYNMDIHPTVVSGHGVNAKLRPFALPLGAFIPADCDNLIPACKNISVTHLVNAATRVHPVEWLIGEVAGLLAEFALAGGRPLAQIHADADLTRQFQTRLQSAGIPLDWDADLIARLN